ncbi:hypothetical protein DSM07_10395 [Oenococcus sp. UCMA 16435]|nr:hypothetical protein [Oenococcus sp. UCMA 14587]QHW12475.1 hypothetical protein DSM07_10395 [Oenococcus sp. UCMA 16435]
MKKSFWIKIISAVVLLILLILIYLYRIPYYGVLGVVFIVIGVLTGFIGDHIDKKINN